MKTQSAKAKGRNLQKWVRQMLIEMLDVHPEDIESRSMGAGGEDLIMARAAREKFPHSISVRMLKDSMSGMPMSKHVKMLAIMNLSWL